jgi:hypothetical protein
MPKELQPRTAAPGPSCLAFSSGRFKQSSRAKGRAGPASVSALWPLCRVSDGRSRHSVKASVVVNFLDANRIDYALGSSNAPLKSEDLADLAKSISVFILCK